MESTTVLSILRTFTSNSVPQHQFDSLSHAVSMASLSPSSIRFFSHTLVRRRIGIYSNRMIGIAGSSPKTKALATLRSRIQSL